MKAILKIAICSLLTLTAFAQIEDGVPPGLDLWQTVSDGQTFYKLADEPIPASFFCEGSEAFTGTLNFQGLPIKTQPAGALGKTDTIVERLDFAPYDENGFAHSRLIARALSFKTLAPIENECGTWDISVTLAKTQPVTEVTYVRETEESGYFNADLVLNFRMVFTLRGEKVQRELVRTVHFSKFTEIPYRVRERRPSESIQKWAGGGITIDTNGDSIPDTFLELGQQREFNTVSMTGSSVFLAGPCISLCHSTGSDKQHCVCYGPNHHIP